MSDLIASDHDLALPGGAEPPLAGATREERFDRIVRLACRLFDVPVALLTGADADGHHYVASVGLLASELPQAVALCAEAVLGEMPLLVEDAGLDSRFGEEPLVSGTPYIRSFAAQPLLGPDGHGLGVLCILDRRRREYLEGDLQALADLAALAANELNVAGVEQALAQERAAFLQARAVMSAVAEGVLTCDALGTIRTCNPAAERIFGYTAAELCGRELDFIIPGVFQQAEIGVDEGDTLAKRALRDGEHETVGRRRSGEPFPAMLGVGTLPEETGASRLVLVRDLSGERRSEPRRRKLMPTELRSLPDRAFFRSRLDQAMAAEVHGGGGVAVLLLELDNWERVSERLGETASEALLLEAYRRLRASLRPDDTAAYLGGSGFAVLFENMNAARDAQRPADRILGQLRTPLSHARRELMAAPNIGIALSTFCLSADRQPDLIFEADQALRRARAAGRWHSHILEPHEHAPSGAGLTEGALLTLSDAAAARSLPPASLAEPQVEPPASARHDQPVLDTTPAADREATAAAEATAEAAPPDGDERGLRSAPAA
ncbi:MAG TPA: diguanylate cyclase [Dehalococcoidia bacterium]|nr:diguanylate cyclase [Dehalococcoidia bacterium]